MAAAKERDRKIAILETRFDELENDNNILKEENRQISNLYNHVSSLEENLSTHFSSLRERIRHLERETSIAKLQRNILEKLINQNEQYSRKPNLVIDGMKIIGKVSDDKIRSLVIDEIRRLKLDIKDFEVVRAHRTGKTYVDQKWENTHPHPLQVQQLEAEKPYVRSKNEV